MPQPRTKVQHRNLPWWMQSRLIASCVAAAHQPTEEGDEGFEAHDFDMVVKGCCAQ